MIAKVDSRASKTYFWLEDAKILQNIVPYDNPFMLLPNNTAIAPSHAGDVLLPLEFSEEARKATILLNLRNVSLVSLGQLSGDNCDVLLNRKTFAGVQE